MTDSIENDLKDKNVKFLTQNLRKYLEHITMSNNQHNQYGNYISALHLKATANRVYSDTSVFINIDELIPYFIEECQQSFIQVNPSFASYYLHLLIREFQDGLASNFPAHGVSVCKLEKFLIKALAKYKNQTADATLSSMQITYFFKNKSEINLNFVKEKYDSQLNNQLKQLINNILQYPESSNEKQMEELFIKMQVFIITNYQIGRPDDHVLLKQCRQALNSILSKGDIQKYVLRKIYHRLEYLQKLGATAAGIILFNNQEPHAKKENVRDIFADLKLAKSNTKDFLQEGFDRVFYLKQKATEVMLQLFHINVREKIITYLCPQIQIQEVNKFVVLFEIYKKKLEKLKAVFEKTTYLMELDQLKFDCVVEKINEILKYRSAIESEVIFPHFVYLSELWNSLVLYLTHLVEINKIKDHLDIILSEELLNKFNGMLRDLMDKSRYFERPLVHSLEVIINSTNKQETVCNIPNRKPFVKDYCALTLVLTGGILVNSNLDKKLCENVSFRFGFANMEYAKFAEYNLKTFLQLFHSTLLTNSDLIVLFELDEEVIKQDFNLIRNMQAKTKSLETQTEMTLHDSLAKYPIDSTWNVWDFYRKTIKLANIRKTQTHSTQSNLSFGTRHAYSQCDRKSKNGAQI